jgi:hypothetical protein
MKKLFFSCMVMVLLLNLFIFPMDVGIAAIASRYDFKVGDRVCIRKAASLFENENEKWTLDANRSGGGIGMIKSVKTVTVTTPQKIERTLPRTVKLSFQPDNQAIKLYEIVDSCVKRKGVWVDDLAPTLTYDHQTIIFDAYRGKIHVNLKTSSVRKAVLNNGLDIAKALQQKNKDLGYEAYFKVDIEYFAWELIAHAYAAEYGLPGYWDSSVADCNVTKTDMKTKIMIEVARMLWKNGPEKTW